MTSPLDYTLNALENIQDAIDEIKVRKNITSEKETLQDYDKVIINLAKEMTFFVLKSKSAKEAFDSYFNLLWKTATQ